MTEYELKSVGQAVDHVLGTAAPGLAWPTKQAIRNTVLLRLRHQFNVPAPPLQVPDSSSPSDTEPK